jgi:rhamnulokinase
MAARRYLALDLGAESGRAVLGEFDGERLVCTEVHRFANQPVQLPGALHWDILRIFAEIQTGISKAQQQGDGLASVGVDGWGVDFGLLDARGDLLANPVHYRDPRTDGMVDLAERLVGRERIFESTGIQFLQINTLYQLLALRESSSPVLDAAKTLLTIPDLLAYWLSGTAACEFTNATTTQCYDPRAGAWATPLLEALGLPSRIWPTVVQPGTALGRLRTAEKVQVIAPAAHDTGSAVAATPMRGTDEAYISSGTWSLVGIEVSEPVITAASLAANMTNEGGVGGTFRLLRNVMGLWLVQGIRASCARDSAYEELAEAAALAPPGTAWIDPDASEFLHPDDMCGALRQACTASGQTPPPDVGGLVRMVLESLALRYRWVISRLEEVSGREIRTIHVVGGGARHELLCQLTADATGRVVRAGPVEATAIGNLLVQAIALGDVQDMAEGRELVRRSFPQTEYLPRRDGHWEEAYEQFQNGFRPKNPTSRS